MRIKCSSKISIANSKVSKEYKKQLVNYMQQDKYSMAYILNKKPNMWLYMHLHSITCTSNKSYKMLESVLLSDW